MSRTWVIAYDIRDGKRRRRLARALERFGFRRQKSVFEGLADGPEVASLLDELGALLDPRTDTLTAWAVDPGPDGEPLHRGVPRAEINRSWMVI